MTVLMSESSLSLISLSHNFISLMIQQNDAQHFLQVHTFIASSLFMLSFLLANVSDP